MTADFKSGSYGVVHNNVWRMFVKLGLSPEERIVYLFLDSNLLAGWEGLFFISLVDIANYTGLPVKAVAAAIASLSQRRLIVFDADRSLMYIAGKVYRRIGNSPNEKQVAGLVNFVLRMPEGSPATKAFLNEYSDIPEIKEIFDDLYTPINTPINTPFDKKKEERIKNENKKSKSVIADATTPRVSDPSSTSNSKGNGQGKPASNGSGRDNAIAFLKTVHVSWRTSIENLWKRIESGESNRPQERDMLRRMDWFTEEQITFLIPEKGSANDFLACREKEGSR